MASACPGRSRSLASGRDGTFYVIAAGRCNHAGTGAWKGFTDGNMNFIGIEAENRGSAADPWPQVQLDAYRRGVAAILTQLGSRADFCCAHREYALPRRPQERSAQHRHGRFPQPGRRADGGTAW